MDDLSENIERETEGEAQNLTDAFGKKIS